MKTDTKFILAVLGLGGAIWYLNRRSQPQSSGWRQSARQSARQRTASAWRQTASTRNTARKSARKPFRQTVRETKQAFDIGASMNTAMPGGFGIGPGP